MNFADPEARIFVFVYFSWFTYNNWNFIIVVDFQVVFQNNA